MRAESPPPDAAGAGSAEERRLSARANAVLLVEDSATQALRIRHAMEQAGLSVQCVASAEAALEALNRALPDVVVTDYRLPGTPGDELCRKIRMNVNTRGLPILMLTSEEAQGTERHVLESGADDYVPKSSDFDYLLLRIETLLRKAQVRSVASGGGQPFAAARLLVVDDDPAYLQWLAGALQRDGYRVQTAASGAEALERAAGESFDAVLLDFALPGESGETVCRRLLESQRAQDAGLAILALCGSRSLERMSAALAAGADDAVEKSRDPGVIQARLRALLRRRLIEKENRAIAEEFRARELELLRARAEQEAAELRAGMAARLEQANRELQEANRALKETQAQLVQSAKMASLGQLVAGIAHEINNPLAFVMNHQDTVARALEALAPALEPHLDPARRARWEKSRRRLHDMHEGLERIRDLVLKLRTFSRLDEGELKFVQIEESIEAVIALLRHRLASRIRLERRYGGAKIVLCYPGPLNQVLMNVLSNAIDAIEGKGEITVATAAEGSMLRISVADTGRGMPAAVRERIFEPFFTTKPVGEGTGLGLSISYGIVRRHGGRIEVRSEPGEGTEIAVLIPLHIDREAASPAGPEPGSQA